MTLWSQWRHGRFWLEIVLAVLVGVAAFVVAAVVSTAATVHVPAVLLGLLLLLAVLAVARFAGILYALPVGVVTIEAFDGIFRPLRNLDGATMSCSACSWECQSLSARSRRRPAPRGRVRTGPRRAGGRAGGAAAGGDAGRHPVLARRGLRGGDRGGRRGFTSIVPT